MLQAQEFYTNLKKECDRWIDRTHIYKAIPNPKSNPNSKSIDASAVSRRVIQNPKSYYLPLTVFHLGLTYFLMAGLISCGNFSFSGINALGANVTPIRELRSQPDSNTTVYIQGKVEKTAPLLKKQAYLVKDETGKIWAITNQTNLQVGDQVVIKGQIRYRSIPIAGKEYGEVYIEEK
ncbi:DNA-binding protein [Mastigocladus laminosus UU774]|nr:DNA-binding protein [Westiellopsis prolifica IICB1]TFI51675.1 DNA-binding protein [Mastigocladus laminosus UU774]